jgi:hypothetical protein
VLDSLRHETTAVSIDAVDAFDELQRQGDGDALGRSSHE